MLCYWIVRRPDGAKAGLVRTENGCVTLKLSAAVPGTFTLFSATDAVPIVPDAETRFPDAEAVLGAENGSVTCFALAPNAAPLACYRKRLSRKNTMEEKPFSLPLPDADISQNSTIAAEIPQDSEEEPNEQTQINTIEGEEPDSIPDTARETASFSALLGRAEAFYAAYEVEDDMVQKEDMEAIQGGIDLFPQAFPGARWRYVEGRDVLPHYEGTWTRWDGEGVRIRAVRGRAAPRPPRALAGFTRYLRDRDGAGYWVRLTPLS